MLELVLAIYLMVEINSALCNNRNSQILYPETAVREQKALLLYLM
ncbi:MAG TPA: hypothetical protein V6D25_04185 [Leptolyngbyaceae cyanobacterium]